MKYPKDNAFLPQEFIYLLVNMLGNKKVPIIQILSSPSILQSLSLKRMPVVLFAQSLIFLLGRYVNKATDPFPFVSIFLKFLSSRHVQFAVTNWKCFTYDF